MIFQYKDNTLEVNSLPFLPIILAEIEADDIGKSDKIFNEIENTILQKKPQIACSIIDKFSFEIGEIKSIEFVSAI